MTKRMWFSLFVFSFLLGGIVSYKVVPVETIIIEKIVEKEVQVLTEYDMDILNKREYMLSSGTLGIYVGDGIILCDTEYACIHEVGHRLDEKYGNISETDEFREAFDSFIADCVEAGDEYGGKSYYCNHARFPGINGNPLGNWGGYAEAYAEMYKWNVHENRPLPEELERFFHLEE